MVDDINLVENIFVLRNKKVIVYGASSKGRRLCVDLKEAGFKIVGYGDSSKEKIGTEVDCLRVYGPEQIANFGDEYAVIIASSWFIEIIKNLEELHTSCLLYTSAAVEIALRRHYRNNVFPESFREKYAYRLKWEKTSIEMEKKNGHLSMWRLFELGEWVANRSFDKQNIIILHPCKVASTTIEKSLAMSGSIALHRHQLLPYPKFRENEKEIYEEFTRIIKREKVKIITLVREPIAHDISLFFQYIYDSYRSWYQDFSKGLCELFMDHLEHYFGKNSTYSETYDSYEDFSVRYMMGGNKCGYFDWFENGGLKGVFGVDVLDYPFDTDRGYSIIRQNNIDVLVMQMEQLNNLVDVIQDFVGIKEFQLHNMNLGKDKEYQYIYKGIKDSMVYPDWYIDLYYSGNKYMQHFYSEAQIEQFKKRIQ